MLKCSCRQASTELRVCVYVCSQDRDIGGLPNTQKLRLGDVTYVTNCAKARDKRVNKSLKRMTHDRHSSSLYCLIALLAGDCAHR